MKQVIRKSLIIAASCVFLFSFSCSKATAPNCDDEKVKESLFKIVKKTLANSESQKFDDKITHLEKLERPLVMGIFNCDGEMRNGTEENLSSCINELKTKKNQILSDINSTKIEIKDIRTTSIDDKTGKRVCACNLKYPSNAVFEYTYTSELSDGGKNFYVNITSGL